MTWLLKDTEADKAFDKFLDAEAALLKKKPHKDMEAEIEAVMEIVSDSGGDKA